MIALNMLTFLEKMVCLYTTRSLCLLKLLQTWWADRSLRDLLSCWGCCKHIELSNLILVDTLYLHISSYYIITTEYDHNTILSLLKTSSLGFISKSVSHFNFLIIMLSSKQKNCLQLVKFITMYDFTSSSACNQCFLFQTTCIIMTDSSKCSECTCHDWPCISVLLESLNHTHNWLKFKLNVILNECAVQEKILKKQAAHLSTLNAKILCLFKTLKLNELHTFVKVCCVAEKLDDDVNEITDNKNSSKILNLDFLLNFLSSSFFMNSESSSQIAEVSLHN